jgi:hypothetical protein
VPILREPDDDLRERIRRHACSCPAWGGLDGKVPAGVISSEQERTMSFRLVADRLRTYVQMVSSLQLSWSWSYPVSRSFSSSSPQQNICFGWAAPASRWVMPSSVQSTWYRESHNLVCADKSLNLQTVKIDHRIYSLCAHIENGALTDFRLNQATYLAQVELNVEPVLSKFKNNISFFLNSECR